jgi:Helix-turn-helix domain
VTTESSAARDTVPVRAPILVSETEGAKLLGVSRPTFRKWVRLGLIAPLELPGGIRRNLYRRRDLEDFAESLPTSTLVQSATR